MYAPTPTQPLTVRKLKSILTPQVHHANYFPLSDAKPKPPLSVSGNRTSPPPPPPPPPMETKPSPHQKKWLIPLLSSLLLSSLLISLSLFSSSFSLSRHLSFFQISASSAGDGDPLFVEHKLRRPPPPAANPVPRLAYLISGSAGDGASLRRTLRALYHPANFYVVHLDLEASAVERLEVAVEIRADPTYKRFGNIRVVKKANLVTYRGPTMVANTLHAAAILIKEGGDWDWFINLSASDYPLVTQDGK